MRLDKVEVDRETEVDQGLCGLWLDMIIRQKGSWDHEGTAYRGADREP